MALSSLPPVVAVARTEPPGQRATWAEVDLDAIAANVVTLKAQAAAPRLMAVVKADGYGHGLVPAARAALAGGADWLGVALVEEGAALRAAGIAVPVLLFTEPPLGAVAALLAARITPAVYTLPMVDELSIWGYRANVSGLVYNGYTYPIFSDVSIAR
jgi:alanine racemase